MNLPLVENKQTHDGNNVPALFKPMRLLGDYAVCAGEVGTDELLINYLKATPGLDASSLIPGLNNRSKQKLSEHFNVPLPPQNQTTFVNVTPSKLVSFDAFPIARHDLDDVVPKSNADALITLDYHGNEIIPALAGTNDTPANAATTVNMDEQKARALKRMQEFVSSFHGNNQQTFFHRGL